MPKEYQLAAAYLSHIKKSSKAGTVCFTNDKHSTTFPQIIKVDFKNRFYAERYSGLQFLKQ